MLLKIDVVAMRQTAIYRSEAETIYVEKAYDSLIWQGPQAKPVRPDGTRNHRPRGSTSMVADCWSIVKT